MPTLTHGQSEAPHRPAEYLRIVNHLQLPHLKPALQSRDELEWQLELLALLLVQALNVVDAVHVRAVEQLEEALRVLRHAEEGHCLHDHGRQLPLFPVHLLLLVLLCLLGRCRHGLTIARPSLKQTAIDNGPVLVCITASSGL